MQAVPAADPEQLQTKQHPVLQIPQGHPVQPEVMLKFQLRQPPEAAAVQIQHKPAAPVEIRNRKAQQRTEQTTTTIKATVPAEEATTIIPMIQKGTVGQQEENKDYENKIVFFNLRAIDFMQHTFIFSIY